MHDENDSLSVGMRWLWSGAEAQRLGRPAELDTGKVVDAAIAIADTEGLAAVTMSRVAKTLGFTAMSLYRYVESKDELVALMLDVVSGDPPELDTGDNDWRRATEAWTWALRRTFQAREWIVEVPTSGPPVGPNSLAWLDAELRILPADGLFAEEKFQIVLLLMGHVRNEARTTLELRRGRRQSGKSEHRLELDYWRTVGSLVTPDRFPALSEILVTEAFNAYMDQPARNDDDTSASDAEFAFGLKCILDGVERLVEERTTQRG